MSGGAVNVAMYDIVAEKNELSTPIVDPPVSKCCCPNPFYPWAKKSTYEPTMDGLNEQIKHFVDWVAPTKEERIMREDVCKRIENVVTQIWPTATVETIGSTLTNLCVPTSDIDMVIFGINFADSGSEKEELDGYPPESVHPVRTECLYKLAKNLEKIAQKNSIEVLETAKVPIVKFRDRKSGIEVDISFGVCSGKENAKVVLEYCERYPLVRPLTLIIKYYLKQKFLNNSWSGGIGSYTLVIMIISYLQLHGNKKEENTLADHLLEFFALYGTQFNYEESVISILNDGKYLNKVDKNWTNKKNPHLLSVEDPHNPGNDVGSIAFKIESAKEAFFQAYNLLTQAKSQSSCPVDVDESASINFFNGDHSRQPEFTLSQLMWVNYSLQCFRQRINDTYRCPESVDNTPQCPVHPNKKSNTFSMTSFKYYNNSGTAKHITNSSTGTTNSKKNKKNKKNYNSHNNKTWRNNMNGATSTTTTTADSNLLFGRHNININSNYNNNNNWHEREPIIKSNTTQNKVYRIVNTDFPGLSRTTNNKNTELHAERYSIVNS